MKEKFSRYITSVNKVNKKTKRWKKVVSIFVVIAVFCTTYALILPAITLENETVCGLEEHAHTGACYTTMPSFICTPDDFIHTHSESCYGEKGVLICRQSEYILHTHNSLCYNSNDKLICKFEEIEPHKHSDSCYQVNKTIVSEGHIHGEECYTDAAESLVCTLEEGTDHTHTKSCYSVPQESVLLCALTENENHQHNSECYRMDPKKVLICSQVESEPVISDTDKKFVCEKPEIELHEHTDECYALNTAENKKELICTKSEINTHSHTDECFGKSVVVLICTVSEHTHIESCYPKCVCESSKDHRVVVDLDELIDNMPTSEEVQAKVDEFDDADNMDGLNTYMDALYQQISEAKEKFDELNDSQKDCMQNREKIEGLIAMFMPEAMSLDVPQTYASAGPQLLRDALVENGILDLSIVELPATLYNYNASNFNRNGSFDFIGPDKNVWPPSSTINKSGAAGFVNSGGNTADQGILQSTTNASGFPKLSLVDNGKTYIFDNSTLGKTIYNNSSFEFVYDKTTGYYTYNSRLSHAQYNYSTKKVELYDQSISPSRGLPGGAYFFNDINSAIRNPSAPKIPINQYKDFLYKTYRELGGENNTTYTGDYSIDTPDEAFVSTDMHFGLQLDTMFYLPPGRQVNGLDMIFNFTGDDDMWLFIDGNLVLDIGGGHTEVDGYVDLTNSTSYVGAVERYVNGSAKAYGAVTETNVAALENLEEDQMHRIQVFYLERHSYGSNCFISFNMPLNSDSSVKVSKKVASDNGADLSVIPDEEYKFKLFVSKAGGAFEVANNTNYSVNGTNCVTDSNGVFKLKDGQTAVFDSIPRFADGSTIPTKVYVQEILDNDLYEYTQTDILVNGTATSIPHEDGSNSVIITSSTEDVSYGDSLEYVFTNRLKTESLVIEKSVGGNGAEFLDPDQTYNFTLALGSEASENIKKSSVNVLYNGAVSTDLSFSESGKLSFKLKDGEFLLIEHVPIGMNYFLSESSPPTSGINFDAPVYTFGVSSADPTIQTLPFDDVFSAKISSDSENRIIVANKVVGDYAIFPETGGKGTEVFIFSGFALMFGAVLLLYKKRNRIMRQGEE